MTSKLCAIIRKKKLWRTALSNKTIENFNNIFGPQAIINLSC
jgi:hypothetical protein